MRLLLIAHLFEFFNVALLLPSHLFKRYQVGCLLFADLFQVGNAFICAFELVSQDFHVGLDALTDATLACALKVECAVVLKFDN